MIERVEDGALPRILCGKFEVIGAANVAERHRVAEVDPAWILGIDPDSLHAGLRVDQDLRVGLQVQRPHHRAEIPLLGLVGKCRGAVVDLLSQKRHRVDRRLPEIVDSRLANQVGCGRRQLCEGDTDRRVLKGQ